MHPSAALVMGASAGGVGALLEVVASLPPDLPAVIAIVLHVGNRISILPELLAARGPLPARHAQDGEPLRAGLIYVAPPDAHLLLDADKARLSRGPRENHARPAIDPLFRTAALHWRDRAIGVVLSGAMDDGVAGLVAIKAAGGKAVVQDPVTAIDPSMPRSALAAVEVDHCLAPRDMGAVLARMATDLAGAAPVPGPPAPPQLADELAVFEGRAHASALNKLGEISALTCPECGGGLWEIKDQQQPLRFRCHTGHGYTAMSLAAAQGRETDQALQAGLRGLREREMLLRRLAAVSEDMGDAEQASIGRRRADEVRAQVQTLRKLIEQDLARA